MKQCQSCEGDWDEVGNTYENNKGEIRHYCRACRTRKAPKVTDATDPEIIEENVKLLRKNQKLQDMNRIERKGGRNAARVENAFEEYLKNIEVELENIGSSLTTEIKANPSDGTELDEIGMIQLSDLHLNELIDLAHNQFDITVASKRLHLLACEATLTFKARGIDNIVVAFTGDLLNSDRRLDERLAQATNRAKATVVSVELITKFLMSLTMDFSNISVISTMGNEGRADEFWSWNNEIASNNYDFTIVAMAKKLIDASNVADTFTWGSLDQYETVVNINGQNVLFTHDISKNTSKQDKSQSTIGRYRLAGVDIDCIFAGHLHATRNTDITYRSSSLAGSNSYNESALNLIGRASQNIAIFGTDYRNVMAIDLQNAKGEGFDISDDIMAYNVKSSGKLNEDTVIFKVVV